MPDQCASEQPPSALDPALQPSDPMQRALALHQAGQLAQAQAIYEAILALQPGHCDTLNLLGAIALQTGDLQRALGCFDRVTAIEPGNLVAWSNRALALAESGQFEAALASYDRALSIDTEFAEAYFKRGHVLSRLERWDAALASYEQAIARVPDDEEAYFHRGNMFARLQRWTEALASYEQAIALEPRYAEAYCNRGIVLCELKRLDASLASYDQALALEPDFAEGYSNRGLVLHELKQLNASLASYEQALALKPDYAEAYSNRGNVLRDLRQLDAALASYDQALALKADFAQGYSNRGLVLHELKQLDAALASYDQALALKADYTEAYLNRGHVLKDLRRYEEALASHERALALQPDLPWQYGTWLLAKMHLCDWEGLEPQLADIVAKLARAERAAPPLAVLGLVDRAPLQRRAAEAWVQEMYPTSLALPPIGARSHSDRIRVAYVSADFREHPVSHLLVGALEHHQRERFELIGVSLRQTEDNEFGRRIRDAFDRFIEVAGQSDEQVARLLRALQVDVAVDLMGHTQGLRMGIFAHRAAPVQVGFLGYAGTTGASFIDYLVADAVVIPDGGEEEYVEQIVRLPHCYLPHDDRRELSPHRPSRAEAGLPAEGLVWCAFTNTYKLNPTVFDIWMRLLRAVPGSVLWLRAAPATAAVNLRREAQQRGVEASRLIFAPHLMSMAEHLARQSLADLYLDTLPYNAHSTSCDALWAGVPVLTCVGRSFASRVAASALTAVGLPELITHSLNEYEQRALQLAQDPAALRALRMQLAQSRNTAPLFDTAGFTRHLEESYRRMHQRCLQGLKPQGFSVAAEQHPG